MIESIDFTRIGLVIDIVGASLIALDLFTKAHHEHCKNNAIRFGNRLADMTNCEKEEKRLKELGETRSRLEKAMFKSKTKLKFLIIKAHAKYWSFTEHLENPRRVGFLAILVGFIFQLIATFI
ncbi:hypothetical protein SYK_07130 [Pseudodesulfovibrio nedwellii]|uniref:Uncharacterized protein n=1 Tax=Pseudodesulfovibrio nedwellii TaxID=2973072 RepID=A0ABM8AXW0_9BACT|nr:hypothetical protein [Pseudodesulfovibrio nedwellii]BDQ35888.1 hypothetical protein SYK_02480 [Pseudodesulfovibrio nedwellii]BDQ36353.1 hypothetical protein SYK_07130 [Pseudodesulfovibrio nedwellii]